MAGRFALYCYQRQVSLRNKRSFLLPKEHDDFQSDNQLLEQKRAKVWEAIQHYLRRFFVIRECLATQRRPADLGGQTSKSRRNEEERKREETKAVVRGKAQSKVLTNSPFLIKGRRDAATVDV